MADIDDKLRHDKIAHHASVRRENSHVSQTHVPSSLVDADVSTSGTHISPPPLCRRRMSSGDTSLPLSRRRQVSPAQAVEVPESSEVPQLLEAPVPP